MHPGVAQHEFEVCLYEMATNNSQPQFSHSSSSSVTVNIGALSNAIGQAASPAQQVTATPLFHQVRRQARQGKNEAAS